MNTPVEHRGPYLLKRDDLYEYAGVRGGKVRSCRVLAERARGGLVTAGSRHSPQVEIVAAVGAHLGLPVRAHVPAGLTTPQLENAEALGAELVRSRPGHNSVIIARARADALAREWTEVPFGMECAEAVSAAREQAEALPAGSFERIVVAVGSGMTLAGITWALEELRPQPLVVGVVVGADPNRRLDRWAHPWWRAWVNLVPAQAGYHEHVRAELEGVELDPVYEAKVLPWLEPGDLVWLVGCRKDAASGENRDGRSTTEPARRVTVRRETRAPAPPGEEEASVSVHG